LNPPYSSSQAHGHEGRGEDGTDPHWLEKWLETRFWSFREGDYHRATSWFAIPARPQDRINATGSNLESVYQLYFRGPVLSGINEALSLIKGTPALRVAFGDNSLKDLGALLLGQIDPVNRTVFQTGAATQFERLVSIYTRIARLPPASRVYGMNSRKGTGSSYSPLLSLRQELKFLIQKIAGSCGCTITSTLLDRSDTTRTLTGNPEKKEREEKKNTPPPASVGGPTSAAAPVAAAVPPSSSLPPVVPVRPDLILAALSAVPRAMAS